MSFLHGRKKFAVIGTVCMLMAAAGAYAYWTQSGSGSGSATTATTSAITVNQTSTITGLYPGGSAVTLSGNFSNPNTGPVKVQGVTVAFRAINPITAADGTTPILTGCTIADYSLGGTVGAGQIVGTTGDLAATDEIARLTDNTGSWTGLTIQMNDLSTNQDACKNAVVHLTYTSS